MSIKGQNTKSIRKKSLSNTRLPVVGTKNVKIHHEPATVGESYIDLSNLIVPAGTGLVNPSPSEIAKMRLKDFSTNWVLTSNIRPFWMEGLSFEIVSNQTIKLLSSFETLEGEIFTIQYFNHTVNGTVIADVRTPQGSGELLEGQTDFNLGEAVPIENLSSQWPMQVFRGTDGRPMLRNESNAPYTGDDSIGNYQMVDRGDGYCQVIRFNIAGDVGNEPVMWASHGALGERPNLSTLQQVDKIHGIMDKMREDLLGLTGNDVADPTRYDNGVPTQGDLKAFGDLVAKILNVEVPILTEWQDGGELVIDAVTTAPTKGTRTIDRVRYKQLGSDGLFEILFRQTSIGTIGSGTYLFSLPNNLEFANEVSKSTTNLTDTDANYYGPLEISTGQGSVEVVGWIKPYDSKRFTIMLGPVVADGGAGSSSTQNQFDSTHITLGSTNVIIKGTFIAPIKSFVVKKKIKDLI